MPAYFTPVPDHPETPACRLGLCHCCPGCGRVVHTEGGSPCASCVLAAR